jgi:hypothetical protein
MSKTRLSPLQHAYWMGFRRAKVQMRRELNEMARRLDDELCRIDGEQRAAREQVAQRVDAEIAGLMAEMRGMRDEYSRLRAIEEAVNIERDPNELLN